MKTKQLLLTCLLVIVGSMAGQKAFAYDAKIGSIYYNFSGSEATVTYQKYDGSNYSSDYSGAIVIPKTVTYNGKTYRVTSIGDYAFYYCYDLTYITIPNSVTSIGIKAFSDCYALSSVSMPETIQTIGEAAFWSCINMTKVNIPKYITKIEPNCFYHCMALTSVTIPKGVTSIGYQAFQYCNNLATLICLPPTAPKFGDNVIAYTAADGVDIYVPAEGMTSYQNIGFKSDQRLHPMEVGSVLPSNKWSDAEYTVQTISYDSGVRYGNENESNPHYNKIVGVPEADANGRNWYDVDYTCNWQEKTAPLNSWCQSGNYGDIYVRRAFYYDNDNKPEELYLACGHDDAPCEYYLNGQLLFSETDGWFELEYRKLTEAQKALLRPGQLNVLAFHVHQNWGGMYADAGLYTSTADTGIPDDCGWDLTWTFNVETGTLTVNGTGDMYDYSWSDWEWNPQQRAPWIGMKNAIKHVVIANGVTSIGAHAFDNCLNLISVSLPGSVTSIRGEAFVNCHSLSNLTLSEGLTHIGSRAFQNTNLKQLVIPNSVETIGGWAFENYNSNPSLESVVLGRSLTEIGEGAFQYQSNLTSIVIPESVTTLGNACFNGCNSLSEVTLNEGLTHIGSHAFKACNLKNVVIPNSVLLIGSYAFENLDNANPSLESVVLGASVTQIGEGAFLNQGNLTKVTCLATVPPTISADFTFANYSADLYVPFGSEEAYSSTAPWSGFGTIVAIEEPSPVIAFADANVKALCVANWDTNGDGELNEAEAAAVTSLGNVFQGKTNINSFNELQYFTGLTSIGSSAFRDCTSLTSITIPGSVTSIGNGAFYGCTSLTSITIPNSVTSIGIRAFSGCSGLTSVTIPNSVTSIGYGAFWYCTSLTSITIPNSVTNIGRDAFSYCTSLTSITIPNSVTSISNDVFSFCTSLTSITIPNSVTSIGERAFSGCTSLTSITIPNRVTSIGESAFNGCTSLTSIQVETGNTTYDSRDNCNAIIETATNALIAGCKDTTIPGSVTSIGGSAFSGCSGLTSITLPSSVTSIGDYAFRDCSGLTEVWCYAENVPTATNNAFSNYSATLYVPAASFIAYSTTVPWSSFGTIEPINGYVISDETTSFSIVAKESGKAVVLTHQFTGDWEALYLPFAIDYDAIRDDFDLAEIDGIVQNDDNYDGIADITVLSIMGFREQMTEPNTPYLIRAKNAGEQTIVFDDVTLYPTVSASIDCSSTSTRYEFTGTYNSLNASALANRYVVQGGELVKGASSLAPCRWYMTATARKGSLNLPSRIRIMPVEDVITGVETLSDSPLKGEDIYNLAGQRLQKMQKGINILNGKKILR